MIRRANTFQGAGEVRDRTAPRSEADTAADGRIADRRRGRRATPDEIALLEAGLLTRG